MSGGVGGFGEVGEDGTWRLRLNEFAHVLKLASMVPVGVEGELQRRLDELPYTARQESVDDFCESGGGGDGGALAALAPSICTVVMVNCSPPPDMYEHENEYLAEALATKKTLNVFA